jgi:hypothetical protein
MVIELRSPRTVRDLLRHKYRKGHAYLREIIRFLPAAPRMPPPMREIFLWRAALLTLVPLLAAAAAVAALAGLRAMAVSPEAFAIGSTVAGALLCIRPARSAARLAALAAALTGVSAFVLLAYPFARQTATLPKISQPCDYGLADEVP